MFNSIKTLVYLSFIIIGLSLFVVVVLGVRQYRLNSQYAEISALSERTLFGFGTIGYQVTEAMISGDYAALKSVIPDIEQLNTQVSKLYDFPMIPVQYKLAMADSIDLSSLVIDLRKIEAAADQKAARFVLQRKMRQIGENLIKVDRIITAHIRDSVIGFQMTVIGTMGILLSCASFILIILYRRGVMPLLQLSRQIGNGDVAEQQKFICSPDAGLEIRALVDSVNDMLAGVSPADISDPHIDRARLDVLSQTVNETTNNLNAVINYAQLLLESNPEGLSLQQREMIGKIVEGGERISDRWQNINQEFDY